jgi:hypothetical protein
LLAFSAICTTVNAQTGTGAAKDQATGKVGIINRLRENWNHLLRRSKDPIALSPAQKSVVDNAANAPAALKISVLRMPDPALVREAMTHDPPQDERYAKVVLPLRDDKNVTLLRKRPTVKSDQGFTWRGEVEETGEPAVLMLWKDGHLTGNFAYNGNIFMVNNLGSDIHTLSEFDPSKLPPDHTPGTKNTTAGPASAEPNVAPFPEPERRALEAKTIVIDVMILYTKRAAAKHIGNPADLLALAIEQANETYRNSGLGNISLRLVHSQQIDFEEVGSSQFDIVYQMEDGTGPFKDLKRLRNDKRADIVGLIIDNPSGCGLSTRVGADAEEAFFVVHHSCAAMTISIAHEVGHIIGARHDRVVDANNAPFPYGHGYINGNKWRTMMSYKEGCGGCPRIPYWSNPRVMYKGEPTGTAASDNARVILEQAERVSRFR